MSPSGSPSLMTAVRSKSREQLR